VVRVHAPRVPTLIDDLRRSSPHAMHPAYEDYESAGRLRSRLVRHRVHFRPAFILSPNDLVCMTSSVKRYFGSPVAVLEASPPVTHEVTLVGGATRACSWCYIIP